MDNVLRSQLLLAAEVVARLGITTQQLFKRIQYLDVTENLPNLPFYFIDGQKTTENGEVMCRCRGIQGARGSWTRNLEIRDDALVEVYNAMYFKVEDIERHEKLLASGELRLPEDMLPKPPDNSEFISAFEAAREIKINPVWFAQHLRQNKDCLPLFLNDAEEWPVAADSLFYKIDDIEQAADMLGNFKLPRQKWYIHLPDLLADIEAQQNEGNVSAGEPEEFTTTSPPAGEVRLTNAELAALLEPDLPPKKRPCADSLRQWRTHPRDPLPHRVGKKRHYYYNEEKVLAWYADHKRKRSASLTRNLKKITPHSKNTDHP